MSGWMLIDIALFTILAATGIAIAHIRQLFAVAMLSGIFSLTSACIFVMQDAVDVAFTEAAVGAGMVTVLLLGSLALTRSREKVTPTSRSVPAMLVAFATGALLIYASQDLPHFGTPDAPVHTHPLAERYIVTSAEEINIPNAVTSVLASYRGYDTFGEVVVIFTAGVAVLMLLGHATPMRKQDAAAPMRDQQLVLRVIAKLLIPFIMLFGLYVQFHGKYSPGGGFQAGVIIAAGVILYALVFGLDPARRGVPMSALRPLVALGVLLYGGVGVATLLLGGAFLDYNVLAPSAPTTGQYYGILLVEIGVGITVTAAMIMLFYCFAGRGVQRR